MHWLKWGHADTFALCVPMVHLNQDAFVHALVVYIKISGSSNFIDDLSIAENRHETGAGDGVLEKRMR